MHVFIRSTQNKPHQVCSHGCRVRSSIQKLFCGLSPANFKSEGCLGLNSNSRAFVKPFSVDLGWWKPHSGLKAMIDLGWKEPNFTPGGVVDICWSLATIHFRSPQERLSQRIHCRSWHHSNHIRVCHHCDECVGNGQCIWMVIGSLSLVANIPGSLLVS